MRKLDSNAHSVFLLYYHLILVIKYRKKILTDPVSERAREIFEYIAPKYHVTLEEWNHDRDHVHIMFRAHPKSELSKFINAYKSASSRKINRKSIKRIWRFDSMNTRFTIEEENIVAIYAEDSRETTLENILAAMPYMDEDMRQLAAAAVNKLQAMTDSEFSEREFILTDEE